MKPLFDHRILVTGGYGYVGSHLPATIRLSRQDCDLRDANQTRSLFERHRPQTVLHSAPGGLFSAQTNISLTKYLSDEIKIHCNVIEASYDVGVDRLLAMSSISAFPSEQSCPDEDDLFSGVPHSSVFQYGYAKRFLDVLLQSLRAEFALPYGALFLSNIYGPGPGYESHPSLIPHLIRTCWQAKKVQGPWILQGDPNAIRDYLFVHDFTHIVRKLLEYPDTPERLILASGQTHSVRVLAEMVAEGMKYTGKILWRPSVSKGQTVKVANNRALRDLFPDFHFTSTRQGLQHTISWFLESVNSRDQTKIS